MRVLALLTILLASTNSLSAQSAVMPSVTVMFNGDVTKPATSSTRYVEACTTGPLYIGGLNPNFLPLVTPPYKSCAARPAMYVNPGTTTSRPCSGSAKATARSSPA